MSHLISLASPFLSYLWIICGICTSRKKSKHIASSLRLQEGSSKAQKDFCHIVGFVLMNGVANVDNANADIWYLLGWISK